MAPNICVAQSGTEIIQKAIDVQNQEQTRGVFELTITTSTDQKRTFLYESFSKNKGEKNLIRYLKPARVKGQATLMLNNADDIWTYFPRTKRVRKLATHAKKQKMEGSDFSYEDMGSGDSFLTDFSHKKLDDQKYEKKDCYVVEMTVNEGIVSSYSRMVLFIDKENFLMIGADYYDENDRDDKVKHLTIGDIQIIQGVPSPMLMKMHSLEDNTETIMKMREIEYNIDLPDDLFTERGLRK